MALSEFGKAFRDARKAGDKTFMFKGKKYTTETKEEKDARMAKAAPKAAPEKKMPEAKSSGRGMMAGRGAGDKMEDTRPFKTQVAEKSKPESKPRAAAAQPERKPIRMEGLERATKGISSIMANRQRRLDMEEADRMSRGDKYGMGMKKGGKVKKSRDGMATKGKTKGRMC
jgi:hypothetical protein